MHIANPNRSDKLSFDVPADGATRAIRPAYFDLSGSVNYRTCLDLLRSGLLGAHPLATAIKCLTDMILAAMLLVVTAPILAVAMFLIYVGSPGPVIFVQERIGRGGRPFKLYKLRTMDSGTDHMQQVLMRRQGKKVFIKFDNDPRITSIGRYLRIFSIDELPQLINVLRGEMSLIGPRPLEKVEVDRLPHEVRLRRFTVQPGLSGLWQVSGRSLTTEAKRIQLDLEYVDTWSLWLDLKIMLRTIPAVLTGYGAK